MAKGSRRMRSTRARIVSLAAGCIGALGEPGRTTQMNALVAS